MNADPQSQQTADASQGSHSLRARHIIRFAVFSLFPMASLFIAAGRVDWVMGWIYVGILVLITLISRVLVARRHPELLLERARSLDSEDAKSWDKAIVILVAMVGPLATLIVAGLDLRFGWTQPMPLSIQLVAIVVIILGASFGTWAMVVNQFYSAVVRIQTERGHHVISSGPYRFMRHPSYIGGMLANMAIPFMLSSLWALIPVALITVATIVRTVLEDRTMLEELEGYTEYAQRVRYRLIPGIW